MRFNPLSGQGTTASGRLVDQGPSWRDPGSDDPGCDRIRPVWLPSPVAQGQVLQLLALQSTDAAQPTHHRSLAQQQNAFLLRGVSRGMASFTPRAGYPSIALFARQRPATTEDQPVGNACIVCGRHRRQLSRAVMLLGSPGRQYRLLTCVRRVTSSFLNGVTGHHTEA
jgi:hypothetical protein